jgi:hypothetical protein
MDGSRILPAPGVDVTPARASGDRSAGKRDELVPAPRDGTEGRATPREGLLGLLGLLDAESKIVRRIAQAFEDGAAASMLRLSVLGITLRDPRVRWWSGEGRDPCLLAVAENREGDAISTYLYPPSRSGRVPVVLVARATGEARWLADDFDVWFAGVLYNARTYAPDAVRLTCEALGLDAAFPRPLPPALPPSWFFEAHGTSWTLADAETALAAGDPEGAERMLVAVGRLARASGLAAADVKMRLASVYTTLGWDHHRATVVETW